MGVGAAIGEAASQTTGLAQSAACACITLTDAIADCCIDFSAHSSTHFCADISADIGPHIHASAPAAASHGPSVSWRSSTGQSAHARATAVVWA